jgi:mono/diheme cytochrome c family protein
VRLACAVLAAGALAAGCGRAGSPRLSALDRGRAVYDRSCTGCHTLSGRERRAEGGDLALTGLDVADLASFARTMPVRPPLDAADANAVAEYVHAVATRLSSSAHGGGLQ